MRLQEWKYTQGTSASGSASKATAQASTATTGFKKRFEKLIKYYEQHTPAEVDYMMVNLLTKDTLDFTENYNNWDKVRYTISIDPTTEAWELKIFVNELLTDEYSNKGWAKLLNTLGAYIALPQAGGSEYKELLTEWVAMNNSNSQMASSIKGGYWERFNRLIYYHVTHKGPEVAKVLRTKVSKDGFHYIERRRAGVSGYDFGVMVNIDPTTESWTLQTYMDGKPHKGGTGAGYPELLKELRKHMNLPTEGTNEYDDLLVEWVAMKNTSNNASTSKNYQDQTYRYERLLAQIDADGISTYTVNKLDDTALDITVSTKYRKDCSVKIIYNPNTDNYIFGVGDRALRGGWNYEEDILTTLVAAAVIKNTDLCESYSSIADDFKTYENLWD